MFKLCLMTSLFTVFAVFGIAQEQSLDEAESGLPKNVSFSPTKDTIVVRTIDISGVNRIHRIRLDPLIASREYVVSIPLKNTTDGQLSISDVSVRCECMVAIADNKVIQPNIPTDFHLKITPTVIGNFIKSATITLSNQSKVKLVIEAKVVSAFSVVPAWVVLRPNDLKGKLITVTSNFGEQAFRVESLEPMVDLKVIKQEASELTLQCVIAKNIDESTIPMIFQVPLIVSGIHAKHEYSLAVSNENRIDVKPAFMIAARKDKTYEFFGTITSYGSTDDPVECELPESASRLTLRMLDSHRGGSNGPIAFNTYEIEGDISGQESVVLNWNRSGKTLATTEVFFDRNSHIAAKKMREARAEFNAELIRSESANALLEP